jgi:hypothetical protein
VRALLLDGPAWIVDTALPWLDDHVLALLLLLWRAYWLIIATLALACWVMAALTLVTWLLGSPILMPVTDEAPLPSPPARGRTLVLAAGAPAVPPTPFVPPSH